MNIASFFLDGPAGRHPDRVAILGDPQAVSYGELARLANRVGNALIAQGCLRGDRVLIVLPDSAEFIAAFFGSAKIGAIAVPVNPMARAADYAHYLADCTPRFAIVHSEALPEFRACRNTAPQTTIVFVGNESAETADLRLLSWSTFLDAALDTLSAAETTPFDSAFLLYTSGSGGLPNGAIHQHKDMLVASQAFAQGVLGLREDDITFSVSKLFFAYGLGNAMYFPFSVWSCEETDLPFVNRDSESASAREIIVTRFFICSLCWTRRIDSSLRRPSRAGRLHSHSSCYQPG